MEWLLPSATILALSCFFLWVFGVPPGYQLFALTALLAWPLFMFSYLHDRMHLENFWMERTPILNIWFKKARRLHDVHHRSLNDEGRMNRNFGIGLFFFDRVASNWVTLPDRLPVPQNRLAGVSCRDLCRRIARLAIWQLKKTLLRGLAPRDRLSRGANALLPGAQLQDHGLAFLSYLLDRGQRHHHQFPCHRSGPLNQPL